MKIAIIGAGVAGLCSARGGLENGHQVEVFEQTDMIGGTWNYVDKVGLDEYGMPIHSAMYQNLRTNFPKELMTFEGFDFPKEEEHLGYVSQGRILKYVNDFAEHFQLLKHIKFLHHVEEVSPRDGDKWYVKVRDLKTNNTHSGIYDAVMICNGHFSEPSIPNIPGIESFKGNWIHSHDYRKPDNYVGKRVLLLGAAYSGCDISNLVVGAAKKAIISFKGEPNGCIKDSVVQKPWIQKLAGNIAYFDNGTTEEIDEIIFCTGYLYSFPFLAPECKIHIEDNWVKYAYKHVLNVYFPSMAFIGLPFNAPVYHVMQLQVRFFMSYLAGNFKLPPLEEMINEITADIERTSAWGWKKKFAHRLGGRKILEYLKDLAETAKVKNIKPVYQKLFMRVLENRNLDDVFKIIDDENFIKIA